MPIAPVQSAKNYAASSAPTCAFGSSVTAGNLLVVAIHAYNGATTISISDTRGNTWTRAGSRTTGGDGSLWLDLWYTISGTGGANTVTTTLNTSNYTSLTVAEFSGIASATPLDQAAATNGSGPIVSSGSVTTTSADALLVACMTSMAGGQVAITPDTTGGWTQLQEYEDGNAAMHASLVYRVVSSTGTYSETWTLGSSQGWIGKIGAFRGGAAAPTSLVPPTIMRRMAHLIIR